MAGLSARVAGVTGDPPERGRILPSRVVEASLAGLVAAGVGVVGLTATAGQLAAILFTVSFAGLVVLLAAQRSLGRRWRLR